MTEGAAVAATVLTDRQKDRELCMGFACSTRAGPIQIQIKPYISATHKVDTLRP